MDLCHPAAMARQQTMKQMLSFFGYGTTAFPWFALAGANMPRAGAHGLMRNAHGPASPPCRTCAPGQRLLRTEPLTAHAHARFISAAHLRRVSTLLILSKHTHTPPSAVRWPVRHGITSRPLRWQGRLVSQDVCGNPQTCRWGFVAQVCTNTCVCNVRV